MTVSSEQSAVSSKRPREKRMTSHVAVFTYLLTTFLLYAISTEAQQHGKIPRIGFLSATSPGANSARVEAFRQGLRDFGYVEGKSISIEWRWAEGKFDRLPSLAVELVRLNVDVIVSSGPAPTRASKEATTIIPIVMAQAGDPVGSGFVVSLARPGGNITGLSTLAPEISGKRLELLKEIVPKLSRVAVLGTSTYPENAESLKETEVAASAFGVKSHYYDVTDQKRIDPAFRNTIRDGMDAVLVLTSPIFNSQRRQVINLAATARMPAMYPQREYVDEGGLITYGPSVVDSYRRAATYVDKILKGAKPAELPVEQPTKFEFIVNLKAARQIGVIIPPDVLTRANRVIR